MSGLITYKEHESLPPSGFTNMGATCYFNAMLQSLLSCTSFVELCSSDEKTDNDVLNKINILINLSKEKTPSHHMSPEIWKSMVLQLCVKNNINPRQYMNGQQCAREGFHKLLESIEEFTDIQDLFIHRYKNSIYCVKCKQFVSNVESIYSIFEVQPNLKTEQLEKFKNEKYDCSKNMNSFLTEQYGYVDKGYICPKCKCTNEKFKIDKLVMVPEILVVLAKKYRSGQKLNIVTEFPEKLTFNGNDGGLNYTAVSQIEHSGGLNGGHYWSISKRNGKWYQLNDSSVTEVSGFKPTANTYMVFYHYLQ